MYENQFVKTGQNNIRFSGKLLGRKAETITETMES